MSGNRDRKIVSTPGGVFSDVSNYIKLIIRLMGDRRVNFLYKLLPVGTLLYFLVPDILIGPVDDAVIVWLGTYLFIELCPPEVVQEHKEALNKIVNSHWQEPPETPPLQEDDVVDAEFWEKE